MIVYQVQNLSGNPAGTIWQRLAIFYSRHEAEQWKEYLKKECGVKHGNQFPILEMRLEEKPTSFPITKLSRADLAGSFNQDEIDSITDDELEYLAGKIGNQCLDCCYWESLKIWTHEILSNKEMKG